MRNSLRHRWVMLKTAAVALVLLAGMGTGAAAATLRVATTALPGSLGNPYRTTGIPNIYAWSAIFEGLTRIDAQGQLLPWLATSWKQIDPVTWHIALRPNVTFSNGARFTSDAVVNATNYLTGPAAPRELVARELGLKSARRIDDLTVELVTVQPNPMLPRALSLFYMVEPEQWRRLGPEEFAKDPVGTGPFRVTRMAANTWDLVAVPTSWRPPKMEALRFTVAPDVSARTQSVLAKQVDLALQLGPSEAEAIDAGGGKGVPYPIAEVWAYQFHQVKGGHPALRDKRVREALNIAVDRASIVKELFQGRAVPAREPATANAFGYDPSIPPIPYDPARAKALLAEAGYPTGFRFVMQAVIGSGPADADVYQKVAQDLSKIGVTMEIRPFPVQQLFRGVIEGAWDGDAFGLTYATPPTVDVLRGITSHSCLGTHPWYCDQSIMPTIRAAMVEADPAKAVALRQEIMRSYRNNYAALFLYELTRFAGTVAGLRGFAEVHGFISFDKIEIVK